MNSEYSKYIGLLLDNRYKIKELIGNGGMSHVFIADDTVMQREVAIKLLKDSISADESAVKRFVNETTAISMMKHKNIVAVYDVSVKSEIKYIAMEYVKGISLKSYIEEKGDIPFDETISIALQVLSALSHAHAKGIVHRDIKPQNIILDGNGVPKVADFGIAKIPGGDTISLYDRAIGTVNYINPEQACGKSIDSRSDIYSFGAMLYEMVTGRILFVGDTPISTAYMQIHEKPQKPSELNPKIPKGLEQIILKAVKKSPDNRFQTADEMISCLERIIDNPTLTFDFVFDEKAESEPFGDVAPMEVDETPNVLAIAGDRSKSLDSTKPSVQKVVPIRPEKEKKTKTKREIEEIVIHKKSSVSMLMVILGVLCALACVCIVIFYYVFENYILDSMSHNDSQIVVIENYCYQTYSDDFLYDLEDQGYDVTVNWVPSSDYLANTIVSQDPIPGSERIIIPGERNCQITLTVSSGEDLYTLENYVGQNYIEIDTYLKGKGLNLKFVKQPNPVVEVGNIISTYPEPGSVITKDTLVILYVSSGTGVDPIAVPNYKGMSSVELELALIKDDFKLGNITYEYSDSVERGCVISQSILEGTMKYQGITSIDFVISLGKEPVVDVPEDPDGGIIAPDSGNVDGDPDNDIFEG